MTPPPEKGIAEQQRLVEIIEELEDDGWSVTREADSGNFSEALRNLKVDFIAVRGTDILVGEVLSQRTAPQRHTEQLARIVKDIPNAEFEVYWIGDEDTEEPSVRQIRRYLRESRAIADQSLQASFLMAMAAFEAALTAYAESIDAELPGSPRRLLEHLFSLGLVSASDHALLAQLYKLRSAIVHTASAQMPDLADLRAVRSIADRMASGRYVPVEIMTDWLLDYLLDSGEPVPASPRESLPRERATALSQLLRREFPSASAKERQEAVRNLRYAPSSSQP